jgi:hypothetical protein
VHNYGLSFLTLHACFSSHGFSLSKATAFVFLDVLTCSTSNLETGSQYPDKVFNLPFDVVPIGYSSSDKAEKTGNVFFCWKYDK